MEGGQGFECLYQSRGSFQGKVLREKDKCKHSCHKTTPVFQAKQTLSWVWGEIGKCTKFLQTGERFDSNFLSVLLPIRSSHLPNTYRHFARQHCRLHGFLYKRALTPCPSHFSLSQSFPSQFSVLSRVWLQSPDPRMGFFNSGKTPLSCNCSRKMAMGQQSPRRNMKLFF